MAKLFRRSVVSTELTMDEVKVIMSALEYAKDEQPGHMFVEDVEILFEEFYDVVARYNKENNYIYQGEETECR